MSEFYDELAPFYHLVYPDWEGSMLRQGAALDRIIRARRRTPARTVLDAACGIGTQSLPLAALGYQVTGSDLSPAAVERAHREAAARGVSIELRVADMREAFGVHRRSFDVVIACDNAVPHLLSDEEIRAALEQLRLCTAPGGLCLLSVRDYQAIDRGATLHPHGVRLVDGTRYVLFQVWDWDGDRYDTTMYVVMDAPERAPEVRATTTRYYAVAIPVLLELMGAVGFAEVERIDGEFFQPVLVGRRPHEAGST